MTSALVNAESPTPVASVAHVPEPCPELFDPVCGCDGLTYPNACFAALAGIQIDFPTACR